MTSRSDSRAHHALSLVSGAVFGSGLVLSGMTQPSKILGFLDLFGRFDASLLFVMLGAIAVHFIGYRVIKGRAAPLFAPRFLLPMRRDIDSKLVVGAAIFGIGWGLAGYCPGPAIVSLFGAGTSALTFVAAMLAGTFVTAKLEQWAAAQKHSKDVSLSTGT